MNIQMVSPLAKVEPTEWGSRSIEGWMDGPNSKTTYGLNVRQIVRKISMTRSFIKDVSYL